MFVVVDGPNGSGKTSLIKNMSQKGYKTLSSPNGTPLAKMLRPACRGVEPWEDIDKKIQFMLFSAARLDEYIREVQDWDEIVVADRWWTSTYVYQCVLQGLSTNFLEHTIHENETIDLVVLLDANNDVLMERVEEERKSDPKHGRCTWTRDAQKMQRIMSIYRNELPTYLHSKNISVASIDTTLVGPDEIVPVVEKEIRNNVKTQENSDNGTA